MKYLSVLYIFVYLLFKKDVNLIIGNEYIGYIAFLISIVVSVMSSYYFKVIGGMGICAMIYNKVASFRDLIESQPIVQFIIQAVKELMGNVS
ncbi:hypothetical protein N478_03405 [Pseudoalteromonas luteoviolacea S4060-1]|uniref:Uncharacterized protein n=1 Tax=Pseudoalteromonas luteoviolacea S4060-1 TaxID=1365257 RepID=A0A161YNE8_9GAMM|nr:hypothetical protein N478_03405 [Pseudoalteromonas luteoviolacea S4060-1]